MNDNLIGRSMEIRALKERAKKVVGMSAQGALEYAIQTLETLPPAGAELMRYGRWLHDGEKRRIWYCSECGEKITYNQARRVYKPEKKSVHEVNRWCRGCGTKMEGDEGK